MARDPENKKNKLGKQGEQLAAEYLSSKGYVITGRNFRTPYGEIDLIAEQNRELVFVEVKTRSSTIFGNPEEAVHQGKMTHLIESAECYLQEHTSQNQDWRIDVIAILQKVGQQPEIIHFENAVQL